MSSSMSRRECFQILGLPLESTAEDIKQAYRTKAKDCHPDKNPDDPEATARFQKISQAYQILQKDFHDSPFNNGRGNEDGGFSFLDFLLIFKREMFLEELRRREAMRRRDAFHNMFFFSPRLHIYDDYDDDDNDDDFLSGFSDYIGGQPSGRQRRDRPSGRPSASYTPCRPQYQSRETSASGMSDHHTHRPYRHQTEATSRDTLGKNGGNPCENQGFSYRAYKSKQTTSQEKQAPRPKRETQPDAFSARSKSQRPFPFKSAPTREEDDTSEWSDEQDKAKSDPAVAGSGGGKRPNGPTALQQGKPRRKREKAPIFVIQKPTPLTKKQLVAQQNRRQKEAREIGRELLAKAEANLKLREEMKTQANQAKEKALV